MYSSAKNHSGYSLEMTNIESMEKDDFEKRKLISLFKMVDMYGWNESVANHISIKSSNKDYYYINPKYRHFSLISEDDLVKVKKGSNSQVPREVDKTGWSLHGAFHSVFPDVNCVVHLHPIYVTIISSLYYPDILPIDQVTARFYKRVSTYEEYSGMVDTYTEGEKLACAMKKNNILMLRNHGVVVMGNTIEETFDSIYHLERGCRTLINAYSTGQKLNILSPEIAEKTAASWEDDKDLASFHFNETLKKL